MNDVSTEDRYEEYNKSCEKDELFVVTDDLNVVKIRQVGAWTSLKTF